MLLSMTNVNKFYNGNQILKNVNLTVDENDRIGLIGINGCGKTTLLRLITGKEDPDRFTEEDGIISFASKTNIGYLEQMGALDNENTVLIEFSVIRVNPAMSMTSGTRSIYSKRGRTIPSSGLPIPKQR